MIRFDVIGTDRDDICRKAAMTIKDYTGHDRVDVSVWPGAEAFCYLWWGDEGSAKGIPMEIDAAPIMAHQSERPIAWKAMVEVDL